MQTLTLNHEKLGPITFQGEAENSLVYDKAIIKEIFFKGINCLVSLDLLSESDKSTVQSFIDKMEIGIDEKLRIRSLLSYQINSATGEVVSASYFIFSNTSGTPVVDMINTILDDLCQLIVLLKHPQEKLRGVNWVEYAEALLPPYYLEFHNIFEEAYDYMLQNATEEHKRVFTEALGENWASILAEDYANVRFNNGYSEEEFTVDTHLEKHLDSHK